METYIVQLLEFLKMQLPYDDYLSRAIVIVDTFIEPKSRADFRKLHTDTLYSNANYIASEISAYQQSHKHGKSQRCA